MADLATFNFTLEQLYPAVGRFKLNSCGNPDCRNFGQTPRWPRVKFPKRAKGKRCPTAEAILHGVGAYKLSGADRTHRRISQAFEYRDDPHAWTDQRTVRCRARLLNGTICNSGFSILSEQHLEDEIQRLRNHDGVLDGKGCQCCGRRYLAAPEEFVLNGVHQRTKGSGSAPKAVRVVHKPCKGKPGARFTISIPHARQLESKDNLRILYALLNSAGIRDAQRMLGAAATGKTMGISRIYDRIAWLEQVFLAYEREMLKRWREKVAASSKDVVHRLSHDDLVIGVNWETTVDRRNTLLHCAITADANSGYVYRIDVDFDPRLTPLEMFQNSYFDEVGEPKNLARDYPGSSFGSAPLFSWQRPTGRLHEPQLFGACINEFKAFRRRAMRRLPKTTKAQKGVRAELKARVARDIERIRLVSEDWFGFEADPDGPRGSFRGMTTRDTYTKAAHFALLREMLPPGRIVLTTEQEAILPAILPHVFEEEIRDNRFTWLAMKFNKTAPKNEIVDKLAAYRKDRREFLEEGLYTGRFQQDIGTADLTRAYIAAKMTVETRDDGARPFPISNFHGSAFPQVWVRSPTQSGGEMDKVVGFPCVESWLRRRLKKLSFNAAPEDLEDDLRQDIADEVWNATLQPVSSFMNSVRERLGAATRAGSGGARLGGTYVQGAIYNPKTLISLLNIFRVHYNFFEPREYSTIESRGVDEEEAEEEGLDDDLTGGEAGEIDPFRFSGRGLRYPGTNEIVPMPPSPRSRQIKKTPAMRHGIDAFIQRPDGRAVVPNLYRLIYRLWLYAGTKVGAKLDRPLKPTTRSPEVAAAELEVAELGMPEMA